MAPPGKATRSSKSRQQSVSKSVKDAGQSKTRASRRRESPLELPDEVLLAIVNTALESHATSPSTLLVLSSRWHLATCKVLYGTLTLPDDANLLRLASRGLTFDTTMATSDGSLGGGPSAMARSTASSLTHDSGTEAISSTSSLSGLKLGVGVDQLQEATGQSRLLGKLAALLGGGRTTYASSVRCLRVIPAAANAVLLNDSGGQLPPTLAHARSTSVPTFPPTTGEIAPSGTMMAAPPPIDDSDFRLLLNSRLVNLVKFCWQASRPPPRSILAYDPHNVTRSIDGQSCKLSSFDAWSIFNDKHDSNDHPLNEDRQLRWDGMCLRFLPPSSMTCLNLQNLTAEGLRALAECVPVLATLRHIILDRTVFVDDALVGSIAEECKALTSLTVSRMAGTKLTNKGIAHLMRDAVNLEELALLECEGASILSSSRRFRLSGSTHLTLPCYSSTILRLVHSCRASHQEVLGRG